MKKGKYSENYWHIFQKIQYTVKNHCVFGLNVKLLLQLLNWLNTLKLTQFANPKILGNLFKKSLGDFATVNCTITMNGCLRWFLRWHVFFKILKSYVTCEQRIVERKNNSSSLQTFRFGVPQVFVLVPFFLLNVIVYLHSSNTQWNNSPGSRYSNLSSPNQQPIWI